MRLTGPVLMLGLMLAGCAATTTNTPPAAAAALGRGLPLEEGTFVAEGLGTGDKRVTISFSPGDHDTSRVSGMGGCNRFNGGYTQTPTTITFQPIAMTMMMCPDDQMANERKLMAVLDGTVEYRLDKDGVLTLRSAKGEELRFRKAS